jgi:hypothetical protein
LVSHTQRVFKYSYLARARKFEVESRANWRERVKSIEKPKEKQTVFSRKTIKCVYCVKDGHLEDQCFKKLANLQNDLALKKKVNSLCLADKEKEYKDSESDEEESKESLDSKLAMFRISASPSEEERKSKEKRNDKFF